MTLHGDDTEALEQSLVAQWSNFGDTPGGSTHDEDGLTWTEAAIAHLPYNAVVRTRLADGASERITRMVERFQRRQVEFLWIVHPADRPTELEAHLLGNGMMLAGMETGMAMDLRGWVAPPSPPDEGIRLEQVRDRAGMRDFESLIAEYWDLAGDAGPFVNAMNQRVFTAGDRGIWLLAYRGDEPVGKAFLSLRGFADTASIWGVYVVPSARGLGIGSRLTAMAIAQAARLGKQRIVLASTDNGVAVYRRLGFRTRCALPVYASRGLPATIQGLQAG